MAEKSFVVRVILLSFLIGLAASPVSADTERSKVPPRVIEVKSGKSVVGLRLANISEKSGFGRAGFISGDIIKSMNGKPVRSVSEMADIISSNESVTAVVIRSDQPIRFTFPGALGLPSARNDNSQKQQ